MKSGRQRRMAIKAHRLQKRAYKLVQHDKAQKVWDAMLFATGPQNTVPVNPEKMRPNNSYGVPDFVQRGFYVDTPFTCKHCGAVQVWTAQQQCWWYEEAQGDVWQIAVLCRPCRIKERERKELARKIHFEGFKKLIAS